jgi:hypothetical protein
MENRGEKARRETKKVLELSHEVQTFSLQFKTSSKVSKKKKKRRETF